VLFRVLYDETSGELTYLLADADAREAVLVDPHARDLPVLQAMLDERGLLLRWVLRTHDHDALLPGELAGLSRLNAPMVQGRAAAGVQRPADGAVLRFGDEHVRVIETPGHTSDCLSFIWRDRVFCGGLLAVDACQRQPHPAQPAALWDSVAQRIFTLPDETLLFAGHERRARAVSTVLEQRRWHPHFAGLTRDAFLTRMAALQQAALRPPSTAPHALI
jgi:glyoxylase-like metal-dependent hydrolase (beta-lactamase superfamily II)